jgi:hypothetical protein
MLETNPLAGGRGATATRLLLAAAVAGAFATAAPAASAATGIRTGLTNACLYDARDARMSRAAKRRYCGCVVGKFMAAHKRGDITAAQLRLVIKIWRGKRTWPARPAGFSEFDYHAKTRCEKATRAS